MPVKLIEESKNKIIVQMEIVLGNSMLENEEIIQRGLNETGNLVTTRCLTRFDTDGQPIMVGNIKFTSQGRLEKEFQTPYGATTISRHVYQTSKGGVKYIPMDEDARVIKSATPKFAKQISSKYAEFGSSRVLNDFENNHQRNISKTYIQDISDTVHAIGELKGESWDYEIPKIEGVVLVAVGLDGTCMLMVEDGWREAMVGTISLYDKQGERLYTVYISAAPEYGKESFLEHLTKELGKVKLKYKAVKIIGIADGAKSNWEYLNQHTQIQILDFYHATEYLAGVSQAVFKKAGERYDWMETTCHKLKHNKGAANKIFNEIGRYLKLKLSKEDKNKVKKAYTYFKNQKKIMNYAEHVKKKYPIGSGVTEAACKTLVKQRLGISGAKWKDKGAATILTLRALAYTAGRWNQFWDKISDFGFPRKDVQKQSERKRIKK
jgi:hypothetical protein